MGISSFKFFVRTLDYILENYVYALKDARKGDHMSHAGISIWHCKGLWAIK